MTVSVDESWRPLTACGDVRVLKYSWGPANALALRPAKGAVRRGVTAARCGNAR